MVCYGLPVSLTRFQIPCGLQSTLFKLTALRHVQSPGIRQKCEENLLSNVSPCPPSLEKNTPPPKSQVCFFVFLARVSQVPPPLGPLPCGSWGCDLPGWETCTLFPPSPSPPHSHPFCKSQHCSASTPSIGNALVEGFELKLKRQKRQDVPPWFWT